MELATLDRRKSFRIEAVWDDVVRIHVEGGYSRDIERNELEGPWYRLTTRKRLELAEMTRKWPRHSPYVAAILAKLDGTNWSVGPVALFYKED